MLAELDHDPAAAHLVRHRAGRAGTREGVEDKVAGIGGNCQNPFNEPLWFWRCKRLSTYRHNSSHFCACLSCGTYVITEPNGFRNSPLLID